MEAFEATLEKLRRNRNRSKKYYIIVRNTEDLKDGYLNRISSIAIDKTKIEAKLNPKLPLLLIEKTCNDVDNTESYTNLWTIHQGCEINWTKHTKGRIMYDYTGIVQPIIHIKDQKYTWEQWDK